jgi:hypothetical protein
MHRLYLFAAALTAIGTAMVYGGADAQQQQKQAKPPQSPQIIYRDRWPYGPPAPPSSDRNYYGPAPGIQPPMERVPPPAPLAQPPINR